MWWCPWRPHTQVASPVARGMAEDDVRARIVAQLPLEERSRAADVLLDNEGTIEDLEREVDARSARIIARTRRPRLRPPPPHPSRACGSGRRSSMPARPSRTVAPDSPSCSPGCSATPVIGATPPPSATRPAAAFCLFRRSPADDGELVDDLAQPLGPVLEGVHAARCSRPSGSPSATGCGTRCTPRSPTAYNDALFYDVVTALGRGSRPSCRAAAWRSASC